MRKNTYIQNLPQEKISSSSEDEQIKELEGPSWSRGGVNWSKNFRSHSVLEFIKESGPATEILDVENPTPLGIFFMFISMKLLEYIVFQSNLYATQLGKSFTALDIDEFLRFIAVNLLTHVNKTFTKL